MGASSSVDLRHEEVADLMEETLYEPKEIKALYRRFRRLDRRGRGTLRADDLTMIPEVVMNPLAERLLAMFERDKEGSIVRVVPRARARLSSRRLACRRRCCARNRTHAARHRARPPSPIAPQNFRSFARGLSVFNERATAQTKSDSASSRARARQPARHDSARRRRAARLSRGAATQTALLSAPARPRPTPPTPDSVLFRVFDVDGDGLISEADLRAVLQLLTGTTLSAAAVDEIVLQTIRDADADQDGVISRADFALFSDLFAWESFTVPVRRAARDQYFLECAGGPALDGGEGPLAPGHG
jgi:Ca2+-binding EF-hand superfamily protein